MSTHGHPAPAVWHAPKGKLGVTGVLAGVLLVLVVIVAGRVGDTARFVTWPVVAFTMLAAVVALVGIWFGSERPWMLAAGVLPALVVAYVLPAAPLLVITGVLVCLAGLAVGVRGVMAGMAMTVGAVMVLLVVVQDPAVECRERSVSANSGPWWIDTPSSSPSSGSGVAFVPAGSFSGTTRVGDHEYSYSCAGTEISHFERIR